jgi:uncharacterized protein
MKEIKEKIIVFYDDDADGFGGAWTAYKRLGKRAKYIPIVLRDGDPPAGLTNKKIYFIDAIFSQKSMSRIMRDNYVVIIDHHKSRRDFIRRADHHVYDVKRSSCVLSWKYFFPKVKVPRLLKHVEDVDLWNWKLAKSREIIAVLDSHSHNFKKWNDISNRIEEAEMRKEITTEGGAIVRYEDKALHQLFETHITPIKFLGKKVFALNSPLFHSQAGHELAKKMPPFGVVWYRKGDTWKVSLRSIGRFDVSKIAEKYGGGGHRNAAGFRISGTKKLPWTFLK